MTRLERLVALRDTLTTDLDAGLVPVPLRPQYVGQIAKLLEQIEALEKAQPAKEATRLDEIAAKRAAKGAGRPARSRL